MKETIEVDVTTASTPMLIEAIKTEHERQGTILSRGMYLRLLTQDTEDIAIELDRLRT